MTVKQTFLISRGLSNEAGWMHHLTEGKRLFFGRRFGNLCGLTNSAATPAGVWARKITWRETVEPDIGSRFLSKKSYKILNTRYIYISTLSIPNVFIAFYQLRLPSKCFTWCMISVHILALLWFWLVGSANGYQTRTISVHMGGRNNQNHSICCHAHTTDMCMTILHIRGRDIWTHLLIRGFLFNWKQLGLYAITK